MLNAFNDIFKDIHPLMVDKYEYQLTDCEFFKVLYNRDDHIIYCEIMVPYNVALDLMCTIKGIDTVESVEYRHEHTSILIKSKPLFYQQDLYLLDDTFVSKTINYDELINNIAYKHVILIACTIGYEYFVNIKVDDDTEIPFSVVNSISYLLLNELKEPKSFDEESKIETTFSYEELLCVITSHCLGARRILCTNIKLPIGIPVEQTNKLLLKENMVFRYHSDISSILDKHARSYDNWCIGHGGYDCIYAHSRDGSDDVVQMDETVALICVIRSIVKIIKIKKYEALSHLICDRGVIYDFNSFHHIDIIKSEFREVLNYVYQRDVVKEPRVDTLSITRFDFDGIAYDIESVPNTDIPDGSRSIYFTILTSIDVPLKAITDLIDDDRFMVEEYKGLLFTVKIKHKESITMDGDSSGTPVFDLYKECLFECLRIIDRTILCHTI